ncbi:MAG: hypothetical protein HQM03_16175 [Magnetococcales bacterium]|nr:hypothetical protein [Magnetococcales bacterium]
MSVSSPLRFPRPCTLLVALALLGGAPRMADALSLGEMRVTSKLGEPLRAEIPLLLDREEESRDLGVFVAAPAEYRQMDLTRPPFVGEVTVKLTGEVGKPRKILVQTANAVRDPYFQLLLKTELGRGAHFRAYRVVLDLPARALVEPAPVTASVVAKVASIARYGPVRAGETPLGIARKVAGEGVGVHQALAAIWSANKGKFTGENLHGLPVGVELAIPGPDEMRRMSEADARALVKRHAEAWSQRQVVNAPPQAKPAPAPAAEGQKFGMRLTVDPAPTGKPVAAEASPAPATPASPAIDPEWTARIEESMRQLREEQEKLREANAKIVKVEAERDALKKDVSSLTKRLHALEQEKMALQGEPLDWKLLGGGAGAVGFLAGALAWLLRRRGMAAGAALREEKSAPPIEERPVVATPPAHDPAREEGHLPSRMGGAVAAALSAAAVVAAMPVREQEALDEEGVELAGPIHLDAPPASRQTTLGESWQPSSFPVEEEEELPSVFEGLEIGEGFDEGVELPELDRAESGDEPEGMLPELETIAFDLGKGGDAGGLLAANFAPAEPEELEVIDFELDEERDRAPPPPGPVATGEPAARAGDEIEVLELSIDDFELGKEG